MAEGPADAQRIEALVRERRTEEARREISSYRRRHPRATATLLQACEWYRRLGLYAEGLRMIRDWDAVRGGHAPADREKVRLAAAYLLNQSGASRLALDLITASPIKAPAHGRIAGAIALDNFEAELADRCFAAFHRHDPVPESYPSRLARIAWADALASLGRFDEACALVSALPVSPEERLLAAIRAQAWGEYLTRQGDHAGALARFDECERLLPAGENTVDTGILRKWKGHALGKSGRLAEARAEFTRARAILKSPSLRIEMFFGLQLARHEVFKLQPEILERMRWFAGAGAGFRRFVDRRAPRPAGVSEARFGAPDAPLALHLDRDELVTRGKLTLGVPLELRLAAELAIAGHWGLSLTRAKATLWPEDAFRFFEIDARVHALLARLRKTHGLHATIRDGLIRLRPSSRRQLLVARTEDARPRIVAELADGARDASFRRADVCARYGLSPTQAKAWIAAWIERGWIVASGRGPATSYRLP